MRTRRDFPAPMAWRRRVRSAWWHAASLPTPSSYPRLAKCLGAAALPNASETLPSMSRGTAIHAYLERCGNGMSPAESLARVPAEWRSDCEAIPLDKLPDLTTGTSELAMAWRPSTGECRIIGKGFSREGARARVGPDEVPMLADWAALTGPGQGVLCDWKSGWQDQLAPAAEHLQLLTYGAVYLLAMGLEEVHLYLCHPDRETPGWDGPAVMDRLDAEAHLERIRTDILEASAAAHRAREERGVLPPLHVGPWCAWCPAVRQCPAQVSALLAVLEGDAERAVEHRVDLTDVQAGALWVQLKTAEKTAYALRMRLEAFARQAPLPLPDGNVLTTCTEKDEEPKPLETFAWMKANFGEDVAYKAVQLGTTWKQIEKTLAEEVLPGQKKEHEEKQSKGRGPTKAGLLREVRAALLRAGAVEVTWTERVKSRSAAKDSAAPALADAQPVPLLASGE